MVTGEVEEVDHLVEALIVIIAGVTIALEVQKINGEILVPLREIAIAIKMKLTTPSIARRLIRKRGRRKRNIIAAKV